MAQYLATKTLKKATPTVRLNDNVVKSWDLEVIYSHTNEANTTWSKSYTHTEDVEYLNKTATQFTKNELIKLMPVVLDMVFDSHYITFNTPPTEEKMNNFNINDLA